MTSRWGPGDIGPPPHTPHTHTHAKQTPSVYSHTHGGWLIDWLIDWWFDWQGPGGGDRLPIIVPGVARAAAADREVGNGELMCYRHCAWSSSTSHFSYSPLCSTRDCAQPRFASNKVHLCVPSDWSGYICGNTFILCLSPACAIVCVCACACCSPRTRVLSVRLMVWNIERCSFFFFLLWLGLQGARWQTTRDRIDSAASLWSRP